MAVVGRVDGGESMSPKLELRPLPSSCSSKQYHSSTTRRPFSQYKTLRRVRLPCVALFLIQDTILYLVPYLYFVALYSRAMERCEPFLALLDAYLFDKVLSRIVKQCTCVLCPGRSGVAGRLKSEV